MSLELRPLGVRYSPYRELVRCRRHLLYSILLNVILGLLLLKSCRA